MMEIYNFRKLICASYIRSHLQLKLSQLSGSISIGIILSHHKKGLLVMERTFLLLFKPIRMNPLQIQDKLDMITA